VRGGGGGVAIAWARLGGGGPSIEYSGRQQPCPCPGREGAARCPGIIAVAEHARVAGTPPATNRAHFASEVALENVIGSRVGRGGAAHRNGGMGVSSPPGVYAITGARARGLHQLRRNALAAARASRERRSPPGSSAEPTSPEPRAAGAIRLRTWRGPRGPGRGERRRAPSLRSARPRLVEAARAPARWQRRSKARGFERSSRGPQSAEARDRGARLGLRKSGGEGRVGER